MTENRLDFYFADNRFINDSHQKFGNVVCALCFQMHIVSDPNSQLLQKWSCVVQHLIQNDPLQQNDNTRSLYFAFKHVFVCILVWIFFLWFFSLICFAVEVKSMCLLEARSLYSPVVIMKWKMVLGWALVLRRGNTSPLLTFAPNTHAESFCSALDRVNGPSPNSKQAYRNKSVSAKIFWCLQKYFRQINRINHSYLGCNIHSHMLLKEKYLY